MSFKAFSVPSAILALGIFIAAAPAHAAWPADHIDQAQWWVDTVAADNNAYGAPPAIWWLGRAQHALTKCGSFTALLLKEAYPGVITDDVLKALTTPSSSSPYADQWYQAIDTQAHDDVSGIGFVKRSTVANIHAGDVLASEYAVNGDTGHVMTVGSITLTNTGVPPPHVIPGVALVNKYRVQVYDSTKSPHGSYASNPYPDSRYMTQQSGFILVDDQGLGSGTIVIYENTANGALVAWAWNVSPGTGSFYYSVPGGVGYEYRPLVAGYLSGPGL